MNNNSQYDNRFTNGALVIVGTLVRTVERAVVVFWDGMRSATEHGTPSLLGFVAAALPILAPAPVAAMTAYSLTTFLEWQPWQALAMAAALEGIGFVCWVSLTETLMDGGWRGTVMQFFFGAAVIVYQVLLITVNAVLAAHDGRTGPYVLVLVLVTFFPALASVAYGYRNAHNEARLERLRLEDKADAERLRQERRADRKEAAALRAQYAKDTDGAEVRPQAGKFRRRR